MDYSFFDALIDSVFVINSDRGIVYCNEAAAKLCESSVRRMAKGKPIYEFIEFSDASLFVMPNGTVGLDAPAPYSELKFKLKESKEGKVQIAIQPFQEASGEKRWAVMVRDVTLEEVLHAKYHLQLEEKEVYIKKLEDAQKQLEAYSKNLEKMVEERTVQVRKANVMLNAIMNSLGQGFLVFDEKGICSDIHTRACEDILETNPTGKDISKVLKIPENEISTFAMWKEAVFSEKLPFDALKDLGPSLFKHTQDRHIKLDFLPLRNDQDKISNVVLVATDLTSEVQANRALEKEKKFAQMIIKLVSNKKQFELFLNSVPETIARVRKLNSNITENIEAIFRELHTLEGEAGTYSISELWSASRQAQEAIEPVRQGWDSDLNSVDSNLKSSLLMIESALESLKQNNKELFNLIGIGKKPAIEIDVATVDKLISYLRKTGASEATCDWVSDELLREPIQNSLRHYDEVVKIVSLKLNKKVAPIVFKNCDLRVYPERYQELFSSLVHVFRNAIDHGIEPSEEREMMGKNPVGSINVQSEFFEKNKKNYLRIRIQDDGQGIDVSRIRKKLDEIGIKSNELDDFTVMQHVFDSGLTTKVEVGEYSGRGIGMNAVLTAAQSLGGHAWVESELGKGTILIIEVPDLPRLESFQASA